MNKTVKILVQKLRYAQGERDAAKGISPSSNSKYYQQGYAEQYAKEQQQDALTSVPF